MKTYIIRRILQMIPVFLGIIFIIFFILEQSPGGPANMLMQPGMSAEHRAILAERLDPSMPFPQKFINWIGEALKGNFGSSITHKKPVTEVIATFMGSTFRLSLTALFVSLLVGIPIGIIGATHQRSLLDTGTTMFALIGISMPTFFFGLMLLKFFAIDLKWLPLYGAKDFMLRTDNPLAIFWDYAKHLILPGIVLGLASTASFMRYTRSSMLEVIKQDYIRTARAKGLKDKIVIYRHALRNAMIPIITLLGFQIPSLLSGAVLTETVFGYPGLGKISVEAVNARDYPVILGINAMLAMLTLIGALVADILYAAVDPRIKFD